MNKNIYDLGGTIRARIPADTLKALKPFAEKASISRIANITGLDNLNIPVYTAYRPTSKSISTAQGKGLTDELAICSAMMEAIESYYAENAKSDIYSSFYKLGDKYAIDPNDLMLGFVRMPNIHHYLFDWTEGKNLLNEEIFYLPTDYISLNFTKAKLETGMFVRSTTGLASGNNKEEALLHSLLEIIERNCLYEFKKLKRVNKKSLLLNLKTIDDYHAFLLIENLWKSQVTVAIFDITNKFRIPTYHCIISDNSPLRGLGHQSGTGTHLSKSIALCRAITEAAQSRITYISGARDDMFAEKYQYRWGKLFADGNVLYQNRSGYNVLNQTLSEQVSYLLNVLSSHGFDKIIYVEHTSTHDEISVVHSVIPGLCV